MPTGREGKGRGGEETNLGRVVGWSIFAIPVTARNPMRLRISCRDVKPVPPIIVSAIGLQKAILNTSRASRFRSNRPTIGTDNTVEALTLRAPVEY